MTGRTFTGAVRVALNRIVAVVALPVALILVAVVCRISTESGGRVARRGVSAIAKVCGVRFVDEGIESVPNDRSFVIVANHSSPMDIPALLLSIPEARFLAAADLFKVPLLSAAMRGMKAIPIERRNREAARRQLDTLVDTVTSIENFKIVIFPEGGIPPLGTRLPFKAGAFEVAIRTGATILPVAIHGSGAVLPPKGRLGVRPGTVRVEALAPISTEGLAITDLDEVRSEAESSILRALHAGPPR
jgi:1-acyl-sn-glycerol-3-phosphate acyltransferase